MKTISLTDAKTRLPQLVDSLAEGPVLLTRQGQPCAALIALDKSFDQEVYSLSRNQQLRRMIDDACRQARRTGGIPFSQVSAEVEARERRARTKPVQRKGKDCS